MANRQQEPPADPRAVRPADAMGAVGIGQSATPGTRRVGVYGLDWGRFRGLVLVPRAERIALFQRRFREQPPMGPPTSLGDDVLDACMPLALRYVEADGQTWWLAPRLVARDRGNQLPEFALPRTGSRLELVRVPDCKVLAIASSPPAPAALQPPSGGGSHHPTSGL